MKLKNERSVFIAHRCDYNVVVFNVKYVDKYFGFKTSAKY
jgi:hypothetical protein